MKEMDIYLTVTQKQAEQKKKKEKGAKGGKNEKNHKSKKVVHDLFVQGTNDSSIVSKRSVEMIYTETVEAGSKHFFQHFVKTSPRRTPVINRGYWIRMKSIRMAIEKIIKQQPKNQRINIINLGCGYDPLPFQLLDDSNLKDENIYCIDVDFPELIGYKSQMINMAPELLDLIGPVQPVDLNFPGIIMRTDNYATMGCDLTDRELYIKQLNSFMASNDSTTNIFIAEVSLAYMTPETANPIIKTSSKFSNSHFLILEQLMQAGENHPFAKRMIRHFKKMEAPLQCVHTYPTITSQIKRFKSLGYKHVNARDLLGCWELVPNNIKQKVVQTEPFDEWEEFVYFAQHYINLHATNQETVEVYSEDYKVLYEPLEASLSEYHCEIEQTVSPKIQRKFHSCLNFPSASFMTCGTNQSRLFDTVVLRSQRNVTVQTPDSFKGRVGAVSVQSGSRGYILGGRRIPGVGIDEVWEFCHNSEIYTWEKRTSLPEGRVKHTAISYQDGILVYGGSRGEGFIYYSPMNDEWIKLTVQLTPESLEIFSLESSKLIMLNSGDIYLVGGMIYHPTAEFAFNHALYKVNICLESHSVVLEKILEHETLGRYGFDLIGNDSKIVIVGGVGKKLYDQFDTIVEIDIPNRKVYSVKIDNDIWAQSPVLIGSDIIVDADNKQVWIVCGGVVCYGFGSVWGNVFSFGVGSRPTKRLLDLSVD